MFISNGHCHECHRNSAHLRPISIACGIFTEITGIIKYPSAHSARAQFQLRKNRNADILFWFVLAFVGGQTKLILFICRFAKKMTNQLAMSPLRYESFLQWMFCFILNQKTDDFVVLSKSGADDATHIEIATISIYFVSTHYCADFSASFLILFGFRAFCSGSSADSIKSRF